MELEEILKLPFQLPQDTVEYLKDNAELLTFKKTQVISAQGEVSRHLYLLKSGIARYYHTNYALGGKEDTIVFGTSGDVGTSLTSLAHNLPAVFSLGAITKVEMYAIPTKLILDLTETDHTFCKWFFKLTLWQLALLETRYEFMCAPDAYSRYLAFLKIRSKDFINRIPLRYIASYLNITPQTMSELRARYAHDTVKSEFDTNLHKKGIIHNNVDLDD